jgi:hypothetical protein
MNGSHSAVKCFVGTRAFNCGPIRKVKRSSVDFACGADTLTHLNFLVITTELFLMIQNCLELMILFKEDITRKNP